MLEEWLFSSFDYQTSNVEFCFSSKICTFSMLFDKVPLASQQVQGDTVATAKIMSFAQAAETNWPSFMTLLTIFP